MLRCSPGRLCPILHQIPTAENPLDNNPKDLACYRWWYHHQANPRTWMDQANTPTAHLGKTTVESHHHNSPMSKAKRHLKCHHRGDQRRARKQWIEFARQQKARASCPALACLSASTLMLDPPM